MKRTILKKCHRPAKGAGCVAVKSERVINGAGKRGTHEASSGYLGLQKFISGDTASNVGGKDKEPHTQERYITGSREVEKTLKMEA